MEFKSQNLKVKKLSLTAILDFSCSTYSLYCKLLAAFCLLNSVFYLFLILLFSFLVQVSAVHVIDNNAGKILDLDFSDGFRA